MVAAAAIGSARFIGRFASVTPNVYAAWRHELADHEMSGSARYANFTTIPR